MSQFLREQFAKTLDYLKGQIKLSQNVGQTVDEDGFISASVFRSDIDAAGIAFPKFIQTLGWLHASSFLKPNEGSLTLMGVDGDSITFQFDANDSASVDVRVDLLELSTTADSVVVSRMINGETFTPETQFVKNPFSYHDGKLRFAGREKPIHSFQGGSVNRKLFDVLWKNRQVLRDGAVEKSGTIMGLKQLYDEASIPFPGAAGAEDTVKSLKNLMARKWKGLPIEFSGTRTPQIVLKI